MTSIPTLLASGRTAIRGGLLAGDQGHSPIKMLVDDEIVSMLKRFVRGFEVGEETLAFDTMQAVGPGGNFLDTENTLRHYRSEFWEPHLFSRDTLAGWQRSGEKIDTDIAMEIYRDIVQRAPLPVRISDGLERRLLDIIHKATDVRIRPVEPE